MKKLLTFLLCFVFLFGAFGLVACDDSATVSQSAKQSDDALFSVQGVSAPVFGATIKRFSSGDSGEQVSVSKRISATVTPASALNKKVDYRVFWVGEAEHGNESVSDYIVVTPDSDGSTDATVTCYKSFDDDVICVQVVTRDGGKTAECVVTYVGFLTEMNVTSSTLSLTSTAERGSYYELYTNNTYTFTVNMDNDLHDVKNYDLSVEAGGVGSCVLYDKLEYSYQYPGGSKWRPLGAMNYMPLATMYELNDLANRFISATINDNTVTVVVQGKALYDYYIERSETCREDVYAASWANGDNPSDYSITYNSEHLPSTYFTVTVTDANTNIASTVKLWVVPSVEGVSLSMGNLEF